MSSHTKIDVATDHMSIEPSRTSDGLDEIAARSVQVLADRTASRRSFLAFMGRLALTITGTLLIHILPIDWEVLDAEAASSDCNA